MTETHDEQNLITPTQCIVSSTKEGNIIEIKKGTGCIRIKTVPCKIATVIIKQTHKINDIEIEHTETLLEDD